MKFKSFIAVVSVLLGASVTFAQNQSEISIEREAASTPRPKTTANISPYVSLGSYEFKSGNSSHVKPTQRFGVGAFTTLISRQVNVEAGLAYLPLGARYEVTEPSGMHVTALVNLEYIAAPITIKKFVRPAKTGLFFKASLVPAYLASMSSDVSITSNGFVASSTGQGDSLDDKFKDTDVQASVGIGALYPTEFGNNVHLDLSWSRSLIPVSQNSSVEIYNEGFLLTAGLTL